MFTTYAPDLYGLFTNALVKKILKRMSLTLYGQCFVTAVTSFLQHAIANKHAKMRWKIYAIFFCSFNILGVNLCSKCLFYELTLICSIQVDKY